MASLREMLAAALEANGRWELAAAELREENARQSAELERVSAALQVSRWLEREGLGAGEQAGRFVASRRAAGRAAWVSPQSMALLLGYLCALGVVPVPAPALAHGPLEELPADYRRYLRMERGLSEHTVLDAYGPAARLFLAREGSGAQRVGGAGSGVRAALTAALPAPGEADPGAAGAGGPLGR